MKLLEIKNLTKSYKDTDENKKAIQRQVLKDVNLSIEQGEFISILGPSGCGKTTLLRCIGGFESFDGEILLNGKAIKEPGRDRMMVFQDFNQIFPWCTVKKNLELPLKKAGIRSAEDRNRIIKEALSAVGLSENESRYPHQLSGGMKQRVAIAKALALKSHIILMDEPFAALDAITRNNLQAELHSLWKKEGLTVIFITHNIQEAIVLGTRILMMNSNGEIIIDEANPIPKPVTPSSDGYGALWDRLHDMLGS